MYISVILPPALPTQITRYMNSKTFVPNQNCEFANDVGMLWAFSQDGEHEITAQISGQTVSGIMTGLSWRSCTKINSKVTWRQLEKGRSSAPVRIWIASYTNTRRQNTSYKNEMWMIHASLSEVFRSLKRYANAEDRAADIAHWKYWFST